MRRRSLFCLIVALCVSFTAALRPACADPVTVRVSEVASGSFGAYDFTDKLVTLEAHFTTEEYQSCVSGDPAGDFCDPSYFYAPGGTTATVEGLGTLVAAGGDAGVHGEPGALAVGDFTNLTGIAVMLPGFDGDITKAFGPQTGLAIGGTSAESCGFRCPGFFGLDQGELILTSVGETATAEIMVGSPVPEPGTWVMVGTGLVGGVGAVRRRMRC